MVKKSAHSHLLMKVETRGKTRAGK